MLFRLPTPKEGGRFAGLGGACSGSVHRGHEDRDDGRAAARPYLAVSDVDQICVGGTCVAHDGRQPHEASPNLLPREIQSCSGLSNSAPSTGASPAR